MADTCVPALGLPLQRIDLSAVGGAYIGETEKNLARALSRVGTGGGLLLFDEADALFGKRATVASAHDCYVNLEVSNLLARHRGVILASARSPNLQAMQEAGAGQPGPAASNASASLTDCKGCAAIAVCPKRARRPLTGHLVHERRCAWPSASTPATDQGAIGWRACTSMPHNRTGSCR